MSLSHKGQLVGEKNPMWKGDKVGYKALHRWLKDNFGKANKCENPKCPKKSQKFEWSLIKGKEYSHRRKNFRMLCRSCHCKYDNLILNIPKKGWQ